MLHHYVSLLVVQNLNSILDLCQSSHILLDFLSEPLQLLLLSKQILRCSPALLFQPIFVRNFFIRNSLIQKAVPVFAVSVFKMGESVVQCEELLISFGYLGIQLITLSL